MAQRLWLLVVWPDDDGLFPCYEIVQIDRFAYKGSVITPGNEIMLSDKKNPEPRRVKIVRVADNRANVQEHKEFLERREQRVKFVLEHCLSQMNSEQSTSQSECHNDNRDNRIPLANIVSLNSDEDVDDSSAEELASYQQRALSPVNQRRRSIISSTDSGQPASPVKLCFDQGTQTDTESNGRPLQVLETVEDEARRLFKRYLFLLEKVKRYRIKYGHKLRRREETARSSTVNDSVTSPNDSSEDEDSVEVILNNTQDNADIPIPSHQMPSTSTMDVDEPVRGNRNDTSNADNLPSTSNDNQVRRMSAHTTDSSDMVPIGDGHAMIPARVLNEIDFRSYTTATRQLLQAIFSRQVLATHSLTGRKSPAHSNKPPKKILDPKLVNDIVKTVVHRCGVSTSLARYALKTLVKYDYVYEPYFQNTKFRRRKKEEVRRASSSSSS